MKIRIVIALSATSQPHEPIQVRDYKDNCSVVLKYCPDGKENIKNVCRCVEIKDIK